MVTEVGDETYLGQIARRLSADEGDEQEEEKASAETEEKRVKRKLTISKELTPLQRKLTDLADLISKVELHRGSIDFCRPIHSRPGIR